jgi:two-component system chemotaxis response regulator CheB
MSVEGFFGAKEQNLVDMIQMWGLAKATGILNIASGKDASEIHFNGGRIVWAKAGPYLSDEDAVYHILALEEGKFRFVNTSEIRKGSPLNASYHEIIMEGMRRLDHLKNEKRELDEKFGFIPYIAKDHSGDASYEEKVFLGLVDGRRNLEKVFNNCGLGVHKSFEVYNSLLSMGVINLRKVRVLVVDDQEMWRKVISGMLAREPYFEIVGRAEDGIDALRKLSELKPDVMTLDLEMPRLDGLKTLYWMMSGGYDILLKSQYSIDIEDTYRCPVVVISAIAKRMAPETLEALMGGASAYITKPSQVVTESIEEQQQRIAKTVLMASQVDLQKARRIKVVDINKKDSAMREGARKLVCVASSLVGGLTSLMQTVPHFPEDIDFSVFVVIDDLNSVEHARSFAEFLDRHSQVKVSTADKNATLRKGTVYISPGSQAIQFGTTSTGQTAFKVAERSGSQGIPLGPIDHMLLTAMRCKGFDRRLGVVLAGDGADGKIGFLEMAKHGEKVFTQDSYSSLNPIKPEIVSNTGIARVIPLADMVKQVVEEMGRVVS